MNQKFIVTMQHCNIYEITPKAQSARKYSRCMDSGHVLDEPVCRSAALFPLRVQLATFQSFVFAIHISATHGRPFSHPSAVTVSISGPPL